MALTQRFLLAFCVLLLASIACGESQAIPPTPENSIFDSGNTVYGFFPSPREASLESILHLYKDMGQHGDFVLIQQNTAWEDFAEGETKTESHEKRRA